MAKDKPKRVKPQLLKGFRDYPPSEQIAREEMLATVREAVELMGFLPLQTASLEFAEALLGSHYTADNLAELFGFEGPDKVDMALRYEFTVSLARYVAQNKHLPLPFRRYQYGTVWRVDKPGPGRYREFMQFDIDIVGTMNLLADAEIIAAMVTVFDHLGIDDYQVRYSTRRLLNGLVQWAEIEPDNGPDVLRVLDKFEKMGFDKVQAELGGGYKDDSGAEIPGLKLPDSQIAKIGAFLQEAMAHDADHSLDWARAELSGFESSAEGIRELEAIRSYLSNMNIDRAKADFDMLIVRGLGYYTGPVFETTLKKLPEFGSVFSGGRYDDLVGRFSGEARPGTGASIGVDRLLAALLELKALDLKRATSQVLVTVMDQDRLPDYLHILAELRQAGIQAEIFSGDTKNLTKQVKYGDKVGIPFAVIAGTDEFESGEVTVKNLAAGAEKAADTEDREEWLKAEGFQEKIPRVDLIAYIKGHLANLR